MKNNKVVTAFPITISAAGVSSPFEYQFKKEYRRLLGFTFAVADQVTFDALQTAYVSEAIRYDNMHRIVDKDVPLRLFIAENVCPECNYFPYELENVEDRHLTGGITLTDTGLSYPVTIYLILHLDDYINPLTNEIPCP